MSEVKQIPPMMIVSKALAAYGMSSVKAPDLARAQALLNMVLGDEAEQFQPELRGEDIIFWVDGIELTFQQGVVLAEDTFAVKYAGVRVRCGIRSLEGLGKVLSTAIAKAGNYVSQEFFDGLSEDSTEH